jgi:hypothetical protein
VDIVLIAIYIILYFKTHEKIIMLVLLYIECLHCGPHCRDKVFALLDIRGRCLFYLLFKKLPMRVGSLGNSMIT